MQAKDFQSGLAGGKFSSTANKLDPIARREALAERMEKRRAELKDLQETKEELVRRAACVQGSGQRRAAPAALRASALRAFSASTLPWARGHGAPPPLPRSSR